MKHPAILDVYSDFLLVSFQLTTATALSYLLDNDYSHDQISRFLAQGVFTQQEFWKLVKPMVRKVECSDAIIAIDDTFIEKPHTTENDIICWHWDHSKKRNIKGINIINFLYHVDNPTLGSVDIPLAFETIEKTEYYIDPVSKKQKRKSPITKTNWFDNALGY